MEQPIIGRIEQLTHCQPIFNENSTPKKETVSGKASLSNSQQEDNITALSNRIIEECKRQGFKVGELELLIDSLSFSLEQRIYRLKHELL